MLGPKDITRFNQILEVFSFFLHKYNLVVHKILIFCYKVTQTVNISYWLEIIESEMVLLGTAPKKTHVLY